MSANSDITKTTAKEKENSKRVALIILPTEEYGHVRRMTDIYAAAIIIAARKYTLEEANPVIKFAPREFMTTEAIIEYSNPDDAKYSATIIIGFGRDIDTIKDDGFTFFIENNRGSVIAAALETCYRYLLCSDDIMFEAYLAMMFEPFNTVRAATSDRHPRNIFEMAMMASADVNTAVLTLAGKLCRVLHNMLNIEFNSDATTLATKTCCSTIRSFPEYSIIQLHEFIPTNIVIEKIVPGCKRFAVIVYELQNCILFGFYKILGHEYRLIDINQWIYVVNWDYITCHAIPGGGSGFIFVSRDNVSKVYDICDRYMMEIMTSKL